MELTIIEIQLVRQKIYEEKNYLQRCMGPDAPETIKAILQTEIDKRNVLIDAIEAETTKAEQEFAAKLILVPEDTVKYVEVKEQPVLIEK